MLALLCLLLVQDTAEATLKKIEEKLQKAETINVVASGTVVIKHADDTNTTLGLETTLLFKGADNIRATQKQRQGDQVPIELPKVIVNAGKMRGPGATTQAAPPKLREKTLLALSRLGPSSAIQSLWVAETSRAELSTPVVSNLALKGVVKGVGTLAFDVSDDESTWSTTVEFDEKTFNLLKVLSRKRTKKGVEVTVTENVTVELGGAIADKEFELEEKKK